MTGPLSRRNFLKAGCLAGAAAGAALCGVTAARPEPSPVAHPSFKYGDLTMENQVFIAYATACGSTARVAETIGQALGARGLGVEVRPIEETPPAAELQARGCRTVLVGSAVQHGRWLPAALEYVRANREALNGLRVVPFCVHIRNTADDPASRRARLAYLDDVRALVAPAEEAFFPGRFDRRGAALMMPGWIARFIPTTDFLNLDRVRTWANGLAGRIA